MKLKPPAGISAQTVILTSFLVDVLDLILNVTVTVLSGSVVMLSQSLEALADLSSTFLLLLGIVRSNKPPDKTHPFGYGRELYFWVLISALVTIGLSATFSFYFGWRRFQHPEQITNLPLTYLVLILSIATNGYALILSMKRLLRQRGISQIWGIFLRSSLIETKTTFSLDLMGTLASVVGLVALIIYWMSGDLRFDGLGAMIIGIVLAFFAFILIVGIRDLIIGKSGSPQVEEKIRQAALTIPEVRRVLDLKTTHIGSERLLVNLEVNLKNALTTDQIEALIDKIKAKIKTEVPTISHIQVELETPSV